MSFVRRLWSLAGLLAVVIVAAVAGGCGGDDDGESGESGSAGTTSTSPSGDSANQDMRIAVLTPGTGNDGSWGQAVTQGAREYGERFGASEVEIAENLDTPDQYQQQGNAFAASGFDLVIIANGSVQQVARNLATQYPDVKFGEIGVEPGALPENLSAANGKWQNGTFLAGALAGQMTETGKLGTIGGFDFPALTSQMEGFALGARFVNPQAQTQRTYINTWTDAGKAKAAAEAQQSRGADIIFSATDQATQGIFQVAQAGGTLKYVMAQYFDKCEQAPSVVLSSVLYNLQGITGRFIEMAATDTWRSEFVELGLDFDVGELAYCQGTESDIPPGALERVEQLSAQIESGELVVPPLEELAKTGQSDGIDPGSLEQGGGGAPPDDSTASGG